MKPGRKKVVLEGRCRTCGSVSELTRHHLVPLAWFIRASAPGRNDARNIVPLCRHCHRVVDGHLPRLLGISDVRRVEKRVTLRAALGADEVGFVVEVRWLNHHYPVAVERHGATVRA